MQLRLVPHLSQLGVIIVDSFLFHLELCISVYLVCKVLSESQE